MSAWDYIMPHRLLVNRSLRKAAQELRDRVEKYQIDQPAACWEVGQKLSLTGRLQSRDYIKLTEDGPVSRTAYEISAASILPWDGENTDI